MKTKALPNLRKNACLSIKVLSFLILFLSISFSGNSQQDYLFENIGLAEGLSNPEVISVFQDSSGFLWISTSDGLNRYDGNAITVFKNDPNDSTTIANNTCFAMVEDKEGYIWIAIAGNAIARYNPKSEKFKRYPIATGGIINISEFYTALCDSKDNIWFGSTNHGMQKLNRATNKFEQVKLDNLNTNSQWGQIFAITELPDGNIIASDYGSGIKIYNEELNLFQPYFLRPDFSPNEIQIIFQDASGKIWFGGRDRLIRYSPSDSTTINYDVFSLFKNPTNFDNITGLIEDSEGYIWAGVYSQGLYRIDKENNNIEKVNFTYSNSDISQSFTIQTILKDKYGVIWIGLFGNGLTKFDPLRKPFNYSKFNLEKVADGKSIIVSTIDGVEKDNTVWVGTTSKGIFSYNLESKKLENLKIKFDQATIPGGIINIQSLAEDDAGNKWFSCNNLGLFKIDKNNRLSSINTKSKNLTSGFNILSIKTDFSGNIWIASRYGFEKYDPFQNKFSLLPTIMSKKISKNLLQKTHEIIDSRAPISAILKVGEASSLEEKFTLEHDQKVIIVCVGEGRMYQGNNGIWDRGSVLTENGELIWSMNDMSKTYNAGGGFKNRIAIKCLDLKSGDYKLAYATDVGHSYGTWNVVPPPDSTWYGIQVLNVNDSEYEQLKQLNETEINSDKYMPMEIGTCLEFSKKIKNTIWLGSGINGFFKYNLETGNYKQYHYDLKNKFSPGNAITFIFEDNEGIVWVATSGNLLRFNPGDESIEKFSQKDGLPSNLVNSIIEDLEGNLWINTSGGLSKLNKNAPREKWNFVNFDASDGLQNYSSSKAIWMSKEGEIILGSNDGIISFYPGKINEMKPDLVIEDIKISDVSLKSDSSSIELEKSITETDELSLSYTENNLSFEFASIHFSRPEKNKVLYILEGFDNHWISTDRNFASYTNLSPGEYNFRIKGSNGDGIWNDEGKSLRINISPPWWKTTLAYISYGILFLLIVFGIDRVQRRRILDKQRALAKDKELEQAREIEKAYHELKTTQSQLVHAEKMASLGELTAGIAHEIQNPLNFVNNFSELSVDMIDELTEEMEKGNQDEINILKKDLKQNLEKINQHGKRASSIVKGMLEHSRSGNNEKQPIDINALADEYLRLAYHGLRAKDKSFQSDYRLDADENLPKVNVVSQDIGRVLLNLINNAFYAVAEKAKQNHADYKPEVVVSTKRLNDKIEISVKDNGNGIPDTVKDKIFQPFFTTKPTGQGTGLGLSMSYDIITKGHGGEIKMESKEGEGSEFIIQLPIEAK
ncbi:MAG: two-component regulator propeller domain-containing protein [Bacteroidales bacterium]